MSGFADPEGGAHCLGTTETDQSMERGNDGDQQKDGETV